MFSPSERTWFWFLPRLHDGRPPLDAYMLTAISERDKRKRKWHRGDVRARIRRGQKSSWQRECGCNYHHNALTCASKRDVTRKWYTHAIFLRNMFPSHPLCFSSSFQLFLCSFLYWLHPLLTSPSSLHLPFSRFLSFLCAPPPEKLSEIEMCPAPWRGPRTETNSLFLFFIVSPAYRPRLMIPTLLHIFTFVTQFLILVQVCYSAQPPCVFPVAPACVFIIQTLRMCYKRSAINLLVPWELCCLRE